MDLLNAVVNKQRVIVNEQHGETSHRLSDRQQHLARPAH